MHSMGSLNQNKTKDLKSLVMWRLVVFFVKNHLCWWKSIWSDSGRNAQARRNVLKFYSRDVESVWISPGRWQVTKWNAPFPWIKSWISLNIVGNIGGVQNSTKYRTNATYYIFWVKVKTSIPLDTFLLWKSASSSVQVRENKRGHGVYLWRWVIFSFIFTFRGLKRQICAVTY